MEEYRTHTFVVKWSSTKNMMYTFVVRCRSTENMAHTFVFKWSSTENKTKVCCQVEEYREDSMSKFIDKRQSTESTSPIQNLWQVVDWRVHEFTGKW